ncbi:MAG: ATP-binding cassette domain-containing protein, partial [Microbacterium sp.]|nr:ATP-binding cassette domain-containing protein [Microbacterium sp.]
MTATTTGPASPAATPPRDEIVGSVAIDRVTKRYGGQVAVDDLSLDIRAGEFLSLLGPSGCGKTTTLRMIAGFEHPDAGDIRISGTSVLSLPPYRRNVNTVFQAYALFPHMTVAQNVAYGLQQKRVGKQEIRERVASARRNVLATGDPERFEISVPGDDGLRWFDIWVDADIDEKGEMQGIVTTRVETTEQKRREQTLRTLLREVSHR